MGRSYPTKEGVSQFRPLIRIPRKGKPLLSFENLVEAHVLRSLRTEHVVPIKSVRRALDYAEKHCGVPRLLLSPQLRASAGELFLDKYGELINLSLSGQLAMKKLLAMYLNRVVWDARDIPIRLYPFVHGEATESSKIIAIDPRLAFGRPVVLPRVVSTLVITQRIDAGESVSVVAADYGLAEHDVEEAIIYEKAA